MRPISSTLTGPSEDTPNSLLAKQRLPGPIFHYIDGAADDEVTYRRNTRPLEECDLVPNVLAGVENVDLSVTVMGVKLDMPNLLLSHCAAKTISS